MGRNHRAADEPDDPKKGADDAARATFSAIDVNHVALGVTDVGRSRDWYVKHLGLKVSREDRSSCFLQCSKRDFLALFKAKKSGLDHYCFSVPDYDAGEAMKKLKAAGLDAHRHGNRVYFDDPDGIEVQVAAAEHQA
jgi:catechol 2,3-dioxygenase-like lactoylglutathione lyase family enzyme